MESLFLFLWNRSVTAGWLILVVIALRLVLKKAPKSIRPWLWALVGVRLVSPHFGQSSLSLLPSEGTALQAALDAPAFRIHTGIAAFNAPVNDYLDAHVYEGAAQPVGHTWSITSICAIAWIAGMVLMTLWALASFLRLRRRVADAVPEGDGVWISDRIDSPFLLGLFRPRIYLPVGLDEASRAYVLAHERAHIRRRDHLIKPLGLLLLTVYWFQPLAWAAYIFLCRDIELACDERVVLEHGEDCKKPYSAALLECSVHRSMIAACPLAFGEVGVKERVKNVLNYKKPTFWMFLACIAVLIVVGVCFLTDPVATKGSDDQVPYYYQGCNQPDESIPFAAGALLYQNMALNFQPVDGSDYNPILYGGDTLTLTQGNLAVKYNLAETVGMAWDNLYDYFPGLAEEEEYLGALLTDHNGLVITARFYGSGSDDSGPSVWTIQKENGGGQRHWLYDGYRLYALIDLDEAFPFLANGALWTYEPTHSEILPIRFDIEGGADAYAGPNGLLSLDPWGGGWVEHTKVEEGQTVYWKPPLDEAGKPMANVGLHYYFDTEVHEKGYRADETLTIRPVMDYTGLYGGVTYGVSNNWLGAASSAVYFSFLSADPETGDLVVSTYNENGPYVTRMPDENVGSVSGKSGPVTVHDAPAETVQWEYAPLLSYRYPAMAFSFDVPCYEVAAACDGGLLVDFDHFDDASQSYPQGKTLTFPNDGKLYWAPWEYDDTAAPEATSARVTFSVLDKDGAVLHEGALAIEWTKETELGSLYSATLESGSGLTLVQDVWQLGGILHITLNF